MPFYHHNVGVPHLFQQMLQSTDKRLKYNTAILLVRHKQTIPDTLLSYFAAQDEFRYELYTDLKDMKRLQVFPAKYNNPIGLSKSKLLNLNSYEMPDSIVFVDTLRLQYKDRNGYIYFFKYRQKKDGNSWKIAMAGIVPSDPAAYEFEKKGTKKEDYDYSFTEMTGAKIVEDEPTKDQLKKALKRKLYSKRKSGAQFYGEENKYSQFSSFLNFRE
jgi:hypothetical protein